MNKASEVPNVRLNAIREVKRCYVDFSSCLSYCLICHKCSKTFPKNTLRGKSKECGDAGEGVFLLTPSLCLMDLFHLLFY